ncbi:hypothetical protein ABIB62_004728 [Mucilaginibacter sp. UYP25]|uniref:hypothetical protein n=1 Tax=unclassified Mucilaginibacter TaxID=2617802 RepID=UPI0033979956
MTTTPQEDKSKEANNELVFSYLTLRNLIGFGGMLLPIAIAIFPSGSPEYNGFEPSISDYFFTDRGDILVVMLCIIGAFLVTYYGYSWKEWALSTVAGICGIGVAFVPTKFECSVPALQDCKLPSGMCCSQYAHSVHTNSGGVFKSIAGTGWHFGFALVFLASLAVMSLYFFTSREKKIPLIKENGKRTQKAKRNIVFKACGWTIIGSLVILGIYFISGVDLKPFPMVYAFETLAVEAFGFSWLVKGQTLWPDGEHYLKRGLRELKR